MTQVTYPPSKYLLKISGFKHSECFVNACKKKSHLGEDKKEKFKVV